MNSNHSFSPFGIFVILFLAYPSIQGQTFAVVDVFFENGQRRTAPPGSGRYINLIKVNNRYNTYRIVETRTPIINDQDVPAKFTKARFGINDIYTMLGKVVLLRTNASKSLQLELQSAPEAHQLFDRTTLPKLREVHYSYKVSAVYEYGKGRILNDVTISGFSDSIVQDLPVRYIIHSREALGAAEWRPLIFWTAPGFNYRVHDNHSIILTLAKPAEETFNYYLVQFVNPAELFAWKTNPGRYIYHMDTTIIPEADDGVVEYFRDVCP